MTAAGIYPFLEAKWCRVARQTITLPKLPPTFRGTTLAHISDVHHGPFVPLAYVRHIVELTNSLEPDLVLADRRLRLANPRYIAPVIDALGKLEGRDGRFAVLGNHDHWESELESRQALDDSGNQPDRQYGVLDRAKAAPAADLRRRRPLDRPAGPAAALGDATTHDAVILLSHNPDYAETVRDRRVGLILSGHTHGGQVVMPGFGAPIVPSRYGQKYLHGLVQGPSCQVFITRGVGTVTPPVRFLCRPEIVQITLI